MSNAFSISEHLQDHLFHTNPLMPDEYPFWIPAYGILDHRLIPPHHEITINTEVTRIQYVISGCDIINTRNYSYIANAGDTYILHQGDTHNYYSEPTDPSRIMWFHVKGKLATEVMKIYKMDDVVLLKNYDTRKWILKVHEICKSTKDPYVIQEEGAALFVKFINHISKDYIKATQNLTYIDNIKTYIDLHILEDLSVEKLAQISNFSVDYTIRMFKKNFGLTPYQYILDSRIDLAKKFLQLEKFSIEEISEKLHFCNVGYFSNVFYKKIGIRPSEFRKQVRQHEIEKFGTVFK